MRLFQPSGTLRLWSFLVLVSLALASQGQNGTQKPTLDDWLRRGAFFQQYGGSFAWLSDDNYYATVEDGALLRNALLTEDAPVTLVAAGAVTDPVTGAQVELEDYTFGPGEKMLLLRTATEPIYRHSATHVAYLYNTQTGTTTRVLEGKPVSNPTFSPDGTYLGFNHANDLYVQHTGTGAVTRLTDDGSWGSIINGSTDWVYEEEFGFPEGFYFSPDGSQVAYYRFDETEVPLFTMDMYEELYPTRYTFKYPKAGERNATVRIYVANLKTGATTEMQVGANPEQYIPALRWTATGQHVAIVRMNRHQSEMEVLLADPSTGATTTLLTEKSDTYLELTAGGLEQLSNIWFLKDGKHFVFTSEKSGYRHLYLYDMKGKEKGAITQGAWDVTELYGIDEENGVVYYQSAEQSPLERHVYSLTLKGTKKQLLTPGAGMHSASFSSAYSYFVDRHQANDHPYIIKLYASDGKEIKTLEDNARIRQVLGRYKLSKREFFAFQGPSGDSLNGWMKKPADFDPNRRYPVLMFVYGGPGSQTVQNDWQYGGRNPYYEALVAKGYIIVSIDGRGTGARGTQFMKCTYQQLGKYETEDQIAGARYLASLPFVDAARIGIWGWSYGGFMTLNCLAQGADVFKTGVSVAPVTNWRFYDTIYTERYMRTPQENPSGYDDNSPISHVGKIYDNFLLIHGTGDDNVHYQNSLMLVEELVQANKQFELFFYPNKNHGIYGGNTTYHLYTKMLAFIEANL